MSESPIKVLLVEDKEAYAQMLQAILQESTPSVFEFEHVGQLSAALDRLSRRRFDIVLLDLFLPDRQGLATYAEVHAHNQGVPIIVLTGLDDETLALQAVREGAQDYIVKGHVDAKFLARLIRYAMERKKAAEALRQSEEFFRLISENVTDLIAVIDERGNRVYNSPSYKSLLGDPDLLRGTNSFQEIHPEDRERVRRVFEETLATGRGQRIQYRLLLKDATTRHIESQGSVIQDERGKPSKLVVVSRDITEHKESVEVLRNALSDLEKSHEELKAAQLQLTKAEKLEAVSTFAAGVAHEVKNPLQTIILGVDYLSTYLIHQDADASIILSDMEHAVERANGIIHGLLELSALNKRDVKDEDLNGIIEQSLRSVENELTHHSILLVKSLTDDLPLLRLDQRTMKHVFINLFMNAVRSMPAGGTLTVKTLVQELREDRTLRGKKPAYLKAGDTIVIAEVQDSALRLGDPKTSEESDPALTTHPSRKGNGLGLAVLQKIIELYGGIIEITHPEDAGTAFTILFKTQKR